MQQFTMFTLPKIKTSSKLYFQFFLVALTSPNLNYTMYIYPSTEVKYKFEILEL